MQSLGLRIFAFVVAAASLAFSGAASADPSARVARLAYTAGAVSFSPAGENDWVQATVNRPLTNGDRLWLESGARAEIQDGGAMIRLNGNTSVSLLNLDDQITQLQLTQGSLNVRVRNLAPNQVFEVDTPNLALTLRQSGNYRIVVDPDGGATDVMVRQGQAEALGEDVTYVVTAQQRYRFRGSDLRDHEFSVLPVPDEFDRWAAERDRAFDNSVSARYVARDVVGYQDLDANGTWRVDASYGNVWVPSHVGADWAPYRDGHWAWIDPWGWTWIDDAPWGFAVSHYGRWTNMRGTWGWVPGPLRSRAYYAPALVAFVGGDNFRLTVASANVGGVAWFPLAPREVYRPSYAASRSYFENVNRSNTVINNTVINNTYNTAHVTNEVYANRHVPGAVVAVPTSTFVQSQPVSRAVVRVGREMLTSAPLAAAPHLTPTAQSVRGAAAPGGHPPERVFERPVVAHTAPPAAHAGFTAQQRQLTLSPGKPLDDAARRDLRPATTALTPVVKVLNPASIAPPTPRAAAPQAVPQPVPVVRQVTPGAAVTPSPEQRGRPDQRGPAQQRAQPIAAPLPAPVPRVAEPRAIAPQVVPAAPVPQAPPQRFRQDKPPLPAQVAPPAPHIPPPAKVAPEPAVQHLEPHAPAAAAKPMPPPQSAPKAEPPEKNARPAPHKPIDGENGRDAPNQPDENRRQFK
jgi:hypothetical protein